MSKKSVCLPLVPFFLLGATLPSLAQGAPNKPEAKTSTGIETVVVTAQKRAEDLRDIPSSITALQGSNLERLGVTNQEQLVKLVPGVNFQDAAADTARIVVRGAAPAAVGVPNQTTSLLIGEVPFENSYAPRFSSDPFPFDLKHVEILKGPQGTLFGSGSLNGTVRYVYQQPEYDAFHAKYLLESTSVNSGGTDFTEAGMVNIPIGDDLAVRVVASHRVDPGYNDNLTPIPPSYTSTLNLKDENWRRQDSFRVLLGWQPDERWDVHLNYSWEEAHANGSSISNNLKGLYQNTNQQLPGYVKYHYWIADLDITHHFGGFDMVSITGLQASHSSKLQDLTAAVVGDLPPSVTGGFRNYGFDPSVNTKAFTQEVRLVSTDSDSPWRWVVGANYGNQTARGSAIQANASPTGINPIPFVPGLISFTTPLIANTWNVRITELAAFGNLTRKFFDDELEVSLGGRISRYSSGGAVTNSGTLIVFTAGMPTIVHNSKVKETPFSPKLSVTWKPTHSVMAYFTMSKGFRLGGVQYGWSGFNATTPLPETVKSDYLWNYEVGLRMSWLDNTLHTDAAAFHYDWKNAQYTENIASKGAYYTTNVGAVTGDGVEASVEYLLPIAGWSINASAAYTDVRTAIAFPAANGTVPAGTQWPGSFKWQTAASLNYSTEIDNVGLDGAVSYASLGGSAPPFGDPRHNGVGYQEVDAQLGVQVLDSKWFPDVTFAVRNLTNDKGLLYNLNDPSFIGVPFTYVQYVQPRTFVVQLSKSF